MIPWQDANVALGAIDEPTTALREDIDPAQLGALVDDMAANGLLQPIGLRGPSPSARYEVVWGHRRFLAARTLAWTTIPARICDWREPPTLARLAENFHRTDLNPREEARAVEGLIAEGRPIVEIARLLRRSVSWIEARRELLTWPADLQDAVARGQLSLRAASLLAEIDHAEYRKDLIDEAQRTGATAATIGVWTAHFAADRERIITNRETVTEILSRRETFRVMFNCEVCEQEYDTRESVLLRVCSGCKRTLDDEREDAARAARHAEQHPPRRDN